MPLSVHLIGPYPPPYGGVSTHLSRLRNRLLRDGHKCTIWSSHHDPDSGFVRLPPRRQALHALADQDGILHFHGRHLLAGQLASRGANVLFTVHNERINLDLNRSQNLKDWWTRHRTRAAFLQVERLLAVSDRAAGELVKFGFAPERVKVVPAYLPPDSTEQAHPLNLDEVVAFKKRFPTLLTSCAWALKTHLGEDLYGIDLCIALMSKLRLDFPQVGLVLALPGSQGSAELTNLKAQARNDGVEDCILFLQHAGAYSPLLAHCDIYLRASNTDGFCITIAEAFEANLPVVASDVVFRPEGTILFKNRNLEDLTSQVRAALLNLVLARQRAVKTHVKDHYHDILEIYRACAEPHRRQAGRGERLKPR